MKKVLFSLIHNLVGFSAKLVGVFHSPGSRKKLHYDDVLKMQTKMLPGDIILTRTEGELSTLIIPGFWKHAAIYIGDQLILDATHVGVRSRWLPDLIMSTDNYCILRVQNITEKQRKDVVDFADNYIGFEYDFEVEADKRKIYCSELVLLSINEAMKQELVQYKLFWGMEAISPQDLYENRAVFDLISEKIGSK